MLFLIYFVNPKLLFARSCYVKQFYSVTQKKFARNQSRDRKAGELISYGLFVCCLLLNLALGFPLPKCSLFFCCLACVSFTLDTNSFVDSMRIPPFTLVGYPPQMSLMRLQQLLNKTLLRYCCGSPLLKMSNPWPIQPEMLT